MRHNPPRMLGHQVNVAQRLLQLLMAQQRRNVLQTRARHR